MVPPARAFYEMTLVGADTLALAFVGLAAAAASPTIRARLTPKGSPAQIRSALPPINRHEQARMPCLKSEGTWSLDPKIDELRVIELQPGVVQRTCR